MDEAKKSGRGRGRGRGRGVRGARARGRGRGKSTIGRGRPKKMVIESDEEEQLIETSEIVDNQVEISDDDDHDDEMVIDERENILPPPAYSPERKEVKREVQIKNKTKKTEEPPAEKVEFNIDDDISQLVPPTFSTVSKGPPQPMLELTWEHKYTPIGEKLPTPNIHMCIGCKMPIRIYGRLIPCKHVYCHSCATKQNYCSCCSDRVTRIEQAHLGQVFMCHHGGNRYSFDGCRRTYLSQRDLQAHVNHRHKPRNSGGSDSYHGVSISPGASSSNSTSYDHGSSSTSSSSHYNRQNIPVHYSSSGRGGGNLISVPLQSPSNPNSRSSQQSQGNNNESGNNSTPGSRYERKPSFTRNNTSWSTYNNRQF